MLLIYKQRNVDIIIRLKQAARQIGLGLFLTQPLSSLANESQLIYSSDSIHASQLVAEILTANPQMEVVQAVWEASATKSASESAWADPHGFLIKRC